MAQDLRKLFEQKRKEENFEMKQGHKNRFIERLEVEMPANQKNNSRQWLKIAASIVVLLGVGAYFFFNSQPNLQDEGVKIVERENQEGNKQNISLGDLSSDLQKLETYYLANINLELASLEVSEENRDLVDGYMEQLSELSTEYNQLIKELNEVGPNDQTIEALIKNFQLQLSLIQKLKTKLNQLKSSENEQNANII